MPTNYQWFLMMMKDTGVEMISVWFSQMKKVILRKICLLELTMSIIKFLGGIRMKITNPFVYGKVGTFRL